MKKMRKAIAVFAAMTMALVMFTACSGGESKKAWKPGSDTVTAVSESASSYTPTFTVYLKVTGGDSKVLYDGSVTLTSDTMWANEFLKAAITDKGLAQDGIDQGFINKIGDYENNSTDSIYWMYKVNGEAPAWGCNQLQLRNGDYVSFSYEKVEYN